MPKPPAKSQSRKPDDQSIESWYRSEVCGKLGHTHGSMGELDCVIETLALAQQWRRNAGDGFPVAAEG